MPASHVSSLKWVTSTTSVSPSQWPTESPKYEGSTSVRCGRPSVGTRRKSLAAPLVRHKETRSASASGRFAVERRRAGPPEVCSGIPDRCELCLKLAPLLLLTARACREADSDPPCAPAAR